MLLVVAALALAGCAGESQGMATGGSGGAKTETMQPTSTSLTFEASGGAGPQSIVDSSISQLKEQGFDAKKGRYVTVSYFTRDGNSVSFSVDRQHPQGLSVATQVANQLVGDAGSYTVPREATITVLALSQ